MPSSQLTSLTEPTLIRAAIPKTGQRQHTKREHPRHAKRFRTRYREIGGSWRTAFTKDVSMAGLFIISSSLPKAKQLEIEIEINRDHTVHLVGTPRHGARIPPHLSRVLQGGFGVRITSAPATWTQYCAELDQNTHR